MRVWCLVQFNKSAVFKETASFRDYAVLYIFIRLREHRGRSIAAMEANVRKAPSKIQ